MLSVKLYHKYNKNINFYLNIENILLRNFFETENQNQNNTICRFNEFPTFKHRPCLFKTSIFIFDHIKIEANEK